MLLWLFLLLLLLLLLLVLLLTMFQSSGWFQKYLESDRRRQAARHAFPAIFFFILRFHFLPSWKCWRGNE